jgi:predicted nuclease with TOPRIM domain
LENSELRKRIEVISKRLEEHNRENLNLAKQNDTVDIKMEQAKDEMQRLKGSLRKKEEELQARTR